MSFAQVFPARLAACYAALASIGVDCFRDVGGPQFGSLKALLDEAQPKSEDEHRSRSTIQFLCRQNPSSFYKFLSNNKLECLVLWTEARCIVRHLGLRGVVYVKWNNGTQSYDVLPHRKSAARQNAGDEPHSAVDRIERTILSRITAPDYVRQADSLDVPPVPDAAGSAPLEAPLVLPDAGTASPAASTWASRVAVKAE
jgi:hypothetical protein